MRGTSSSFGPRDIYFKASDFSDEIELTGGAQLLSLFSVHPAYFNLGRESREGTCYMLRKQTEKPVAHDPDRDVCLDGLSHEAIAEAFNKCERFICYDEATMYSQYAALCGCLSIVIPGFYEDRQSWSADRPIAKYGIAYGLDDTEHALETQHLVSAHLRSVEELGRGSVKDFAIRTKLEFGFL
jgi:hypothetical protein